MRKPQPLKLDYSGALKAPGVKRGTIELKNPEGKLETCELITVKGMGALQKAFEASLTHYPQRYPMGPGRDEWFGGTLEQTRLWAKRGDSDLLKKLVKVQTTLPTPKALARVNAYDVVGSMVNVPLAMAGAPRCAVTRRRAEIEGSSVQGITMVHLWSRSHRVSPASITNAGAALMAALETLTISQPVKLVLVAPHQTRRHTSVMCVEIDCATLDRARLAWLLLAPSAARRVEFSLIHSLHAGMVQRRSIPLGFCANLPVGIDECDKLGTDICRQVGHHYGGHVLVTPAHYASQVSKDEAVDWVEKARWALTN